MIAWAWLIMIMTLKFFYNVRIRKRNAWADWVSISYPVTMMIIILITNLFMNKLCITDSRMILLQCRIQAGVQEAQAPSKYRSTIVFFFSFQFCIRMLQNKAQTAWKGIISRAFRPFRAATLFFPPQFRTPVHFTHQTLTISSFGYLLWRNKRHCYPFYYSKKKASKRIWTHTTRTSSVMECNTRRSNHYTTSSWQQQRCFN